MTDHKPRHPLIDNGTEQAQKLLAVVFDFIAGLTPEEMTALAAGQGHLSLVPVKPAGCTCPCDHDGGCLTCGCTCDATDAAGHVCPCCGADDSTTGGGQLGTRQDAEQRVFSHSRHPIEVERCAACRHPWLAHYDGGGCIAGLPECGCEGYQPDPLDRFGEHVVEPSDRSAWLSLAPKEQ